MWQYTYCRTFLHICRNDSERQQYRVTNVGLKDGASSPFSLIWIETRHFFISGGRHRHKDVHLITHYIGRNSSSAVRDMICKK